MCHDCKKFIPKGSRILDLGCGSGIVAKNLADFFESLMVGVDIKDSRVVNIPFKIIDGKNIPFRDNEFDVCFVNYVLHHSEDPEILLKEAKRVTKDKILIYEDLPDGKLSNFFCKVHGKSFNYFFQKNGEKGKFLTRQDWKEMFERAGLKLVSEKRASSVFNPLQKKLFVLEKI
jgi:ubiquinone/menaquinone biosynthesis C-methylase UbiE